jgi:hypothetical protein
MRITLVSMLLAAGLVAPAAAQTSSQTDEPRTQRILYVCAATPQVQRAFRIEHGQAVYMTAEQVLASEASGDRWDAPRCITSEELRRLESLRTTRADG